MKEIRDTSAEQIRNRYPDIPRRVSGYNLDELLPEKGFHVARALIGSESTCVTILEATLRLVPNPAKRTPAGPWISRYLFSRGSYSEIMKFGPIGLEGIDEMLIKLMKKIDMHPQDITLLPKGRAGCWSNSAARPRRKQTSKAKAAMQTLARRKTSRRP